MAKPANAKKKLPHTPGDLLRMEDRLERIKGLLREMRHEMDSLKIDSIDLATGTAVHYLHLVEGYAEGFRAELGKAKALRNARTYAEKQLVELRHSISERQRTKKKAKPNT